jgi:ABC-type polysaccharide transport system permease subunit
METVISARRLFQNSQLLNKISSGISYVIWNISRHFKLLVCLFHVLWRDPGWGTLMYNVLDEDANQDHTARLETCSIFWSVYTVVKAQGNLGLEPPLEYS